ncbi:MAG: acetyl-CoA/propionyl-CoA carboxylase, biotin carboxylase, biotin carboxyl carrier protein [Microbacteriaceae bacterium]|nr:acetyl-CoA/propionyl-CoA carboxylase, biotin carboxylase, biotin carboxyl carrier protein [Microbacteriaceae bacterium]
MTAFDSVLVANRGEIACRVIRTLRALGIRTIAVYSDADRAAKHVAMADVAVRIGPAAPQASYLNIDAILAAARETGAQAIHPGYGFLSESAAFASACEAAGIVFIGPGVRALEVMGDKIRSKNHVASNGVPTIPGVDEPSLSNEKLVEAAAGVGYPLLIKPSAGGGGKGMQVVERADDLPAALATARRIAASAFGDDTLLLERLVTAPRHIEVQVLADSHGAVIHLGERECSLQRRHQKVIEEAPSPLLDDGMRSRIGEAACQVARSVEYTGAGTVEFLVSAEAPDEFFFMEMNTRLQVEHPVTELITGIDLVEWQVRIAAGQPLEFAQSDIALTGHAIEARVYAENPERGFLPTTGTVRALAESAGDGIRVDSSLVPGLDIPPDYDPLLSKVIAWGSEREQALGRLDVALASTTILGVQTNIEYLRALIAEPEVQAGDLDTGLIDRRLGGLQFRSPDHAILATAALAFHAERWALGDGSPWRQPSGWRLGEARPVRYSLAVSATDVVDVLVSGAPDRATVTIGEETHAAGIAERPGPVQAGHPRIVLVEFGGVTRPLQIARDGETVWIGDAGFTCELSLRSRAAQVADQLATISRVAGEASPDIRSPMPGTVITVGAATGDRVEAGQTLLTVEAMKMEHKLQASVEGVVHINVKPGDLVRSDQIVATITTSGPT